MTPKYCKECIFCKMEYIPQGKGYAQMYLCGNINCSDPVDASPIPCGIARKESILCGMQGKYHQPVKPAPTAPETGNVIQLETIQ